MVSRTGKKELKFPSAHWAQTGPSVWPARQGDLPWLSNTTGSQIGQNGVAAYLAVAQRPSGWPSSACSQCALGARLALHGAVGAHARLVCDTVGDGPAVPRHEVGLHRDYPGSRAHTQDKEAWTVAHQNEMAVWTSEDYQRTMMFHRWNADVRRWKVARRLRRLWNGSYTIRSR
jgi:hypothetical protein